MSTFYRYPTRKEVEQANRSRLDALHSETRTFIAHDVPGKDSKGKELTEERTTRLLDKGLLALKTVELKVCCYPIRNLS
jgi:hypothetical protein